MLRLYGLARLARLKALMPRVSVCAGLVRVLLAIAEPFPRTASAAAIGRSRVVLAALAAHGYAHARPIGVRG